MKMRLNFTKLLMMFSPLMVLAAISVAIHPREWFQSPVWTVAFLAIPLGTSGLLWSLGRETWCLELTSDALLHHTLWRHEVFDWKDMGPIGLGKVTLLGPLGIKVAEFSYRPSQAGPVRGVIGQMMPRRILLVFGDVDAEITVDLLEEWRQRGSR